MDSEKQPNLGSSSKQTLQPINSDDVAKLKIKGSSKKWSRKKKIIIFTILGLVLVLAIIAGVYIAKIVSTSEQVLDGSVSDFLTKNDKLATDQYGRSNVLVFGTSEDDEGHSGASLADSIMVVSVNQETKASIMLSIPRDLWVDYDGACGESMPSGKINALYSCAIDYNNGDKSVAAKAFADKVGDIMGVSVPYYANVNYSVIRNLTDSLGGIDVDVYSDDPRGLYDIRLDLTLPSGVSHLDGDTALKLARARNSKGGYGLSRSNFDREINQQRIVKAMQAKALSSGVLLDPNKAFSVLDSLGANMSTNIKMSELRTVFDVAGSINTDDMVSLSLTDDPKLVTTDSYNGSSIVRPEVGLVDYSAIREYIAQSFKETPAVSTDQNS